MSPSPSVRSYGLAALAVLPFVAVALGAWLVVTRPEGNTAEVRLQIPRGASPRQIVAILEEAGLAERPEITFWTLRLRGSFANVQAGSYRIPGDANAIEIAEILKSPSELGDLQLMLIPGESVWQVARRLEAGGFGKAEELESLAADHRFVAEELDLPVGPPRPPRPDGVPATYLEGFLMPGTYDVPPEAGTREIVRAAAARFRKAMDGLIARYRADLMALRQRFEVGPTELVILASLVEKEVKVPDEAARVAGVLYNRLGRKMPLQFDPTLVYRPDRVGRPPTRADRLDATNPYNTYAHVGLPPGPICSPGRGALEAVLRPARHDLLYFVARRDGSGRHDFSRTLAEHEAKVERYLGSPSKARGDKRGEPLR